MRRKTTLLSATLFSLAFFCLTSQVNAGSYTFTNIVDNTGLYDWVYNPMINNNKTVGFYGYEGSTGTTSINTVTAGVTTRIADTSGEFFSFDGDPGNYPAMNNHGTVAFYGQQTSEYGIYTGNGGAITSIAVKDGASPFDFIDDNPSINDNGVVAFRVGEGSGEAIYVGSGGALTKISNGVISAGVPAINNAGTVAFMVNLGGGDAAIAIGNGGSVTPLVETSGAFRYFNTWDQIAINDGGVVAFHARTDDGVNGIFTTDGTTTATIVDTNGPISFRFIPAANWAFNNNGTVAFQASLDAGGGGIFTGPDPATNSVIQLGDSLFGETVTNLLNGGRLGITDDGTIVFNYILENGVSGIAIATPVPEPSTFALLSIGLLSIGGYATRKRWQ